MFKNTFYPTVVITSVLLVFGLSMVPPALAVIFTVNSTEDLPDDLTIPGTCHTAANTCTLRAAIMQANRTSGAGASIRVPAGIYYLTIPAAGTNGEENGDLNLTAPANVPGPKISFVGDGPDLTIIDGNQLDRVFHIAPNREVSISGVTIRNGFRKTSIYELGGGIFNQGVLAITNSKISSNMVSLLGGGICNGGLALLNVTNSTISSNEAGSEGGGIWNSPHATFRITNSTISANVAGGKGGGIYNGEEGVISNCTINGNLASYGGGIYNAVILTMINSTISRNIALGDGGGVYNGGYVAKAKAFNSTITQNDADHDRDPLGGRGGGLYNLGTFDLYNTLVAGNSRQDAPVPDECYGTLNSYGWNLFGNQVLDEPGCTVINQGGSWDILDGGLGPLQDNGGPTLTHMLLPGSNAIDHSDLARGCIGPDGLPLATDQRGKPRVSGLRCDIGAVERQPEDTYYLLSVNPSGNGSGMVIGNGISCAWDGNNRSGTCEVNLSANTSINLTASPVNWSTFTGWNGGTGPAAVCIGTGACSFTVTAAAGVGLTFTPGGSIFLPFIIQH